MLSADYIGGLFDGEGTATAYRYRRKGRVETSYGYSINAAITMTDHALMQELADSVPVVSKLLTQREEKRNPNWRTSYRWSVHGKEAATFLHWVLPHMHLGDKILAAEACIELYETVQKYRASLKGQSNMGRRLPEEEIVKRESILLRVRVANHTEHRVHTGDHQGLVKSI